MMLQYSALVGIMPLSAEKKLLKCKKREKFVVLSSQVTVLLTKSYKNADVVFFSMNVAENCIHRTSTLRFTGK